MTRKSIRLLLSILVTLIPQHLVSVSLLGIFVCLLWIWGMMEFGFDRESFRFLTVLIPLKLVLTGKSRQLNKTNSKRSFLLENYLRPKIKTELNVNVPFLIHNSLHFKNKKQRIMYTHL